MADVPIDEPQTDVPTSAPSVPCRHLRSKGMYVYNDGTTEAHDDYESSIFWCLRTMTGFGPDDDIVDRQGCTCGGRSCYEPI